MGDEAAWRGPERMGGGPSGGGGRHRPLVVLRVWSGQLSTPASPSTAEKGKALNAQLGSHTDEGDLQQERSRA